MSIRPSSLPADALLARFAGSGAYTDCYVAELVDTIALADYVHAFYTGPVFRIERLLLKLVLGRASTDAQLLQLTAGNVQQFSAWRVEGRTPSQLLMCDIAGRTRSWFMVAPAAGAGTRLYFGSAVVPVVDKATGRLRMGFAFTALLGFHRLYSRVLLAQARKRLVDARR